LIGSTFTSFKSLLVEKFRRIFQQSRFLYEIFEKLREIVLWLLTRMCCGMKLLRRVGKRADRFIEIQLEGDMLGSVKQIKLSWRLDRLNHSSRHFGIPLPDLKAKENFQFNPGHFSADDGHRQSRLTQVPAGLNRRRDLKGLALN
jgi:hypothetical protein